MPQKSVEPVPTRSSTTSSGPAPSSSSAIPAPTATGRYRSRYDASSSRADPGVLAPRLQPGQSGAYATTRFPLGPRSTTVRTGIGIRTSMLGPNRRAALRPERGGAPPPPAERAASTVRFVAVVSERLSAAA